MTNKLQSLADQLRLAQKSVLPVAALSEQNPDLSLAEAYEIQRINIQHRLDQGETVIGHKIGLTSLAMQAQLGVNEPDVGVITNTMVTPDNGHLDVNSLISPRVEAEIAFKISQDVTSVSDVNAIYSSIESVMLAAEVIDSRLKDWKIQLVDTVADNASCASVIFGKEIPATQELLDSLPQMLVYIETDGQTVDSGSGSAVLGNPLLAIEWLAKTLIANGNHLRKGDLVIAGAVHASIPLLAGKHFAVKNSELPAVTFTT